MIVFGSSRRFATPREESEILPRISVRTLTKSRNSRVALGVVPQGSRRSVRADFPHTARHDADSRALRYPWSSRGQRIGVQGPRPVARPRLRDAAPPSLDRVLAARVPRLRWYYGALRFPAVLPGSLRFLRETVTAPCACVCRSTQARRRLGARDVWVRPPLCGLSLARRRRPGVPSSRGTLLCLCPVL